MTFYHVCDDCGNRINLSNRVNAELPYFLKLRARYARYTMAKIESDYRNRVERSTPKPSSKHFRHTRNLLRWWLPNNVIDYDMIDSEYEAEDSFWSMEDIIVICPSCGKVDSLEAYETPDVRMIPWEALCSSRT